jgi:hypothetical protein
MSKCQSQTSVVELSRTEREGEGEEDGSNLRRGDLLECEVDGSEGRRGAAAEEASVVELQQRKDELEDEVVYLKESFNEVVAMLEVLRQGPERTGE